MGIEGIVGAAWHEAHAVMGQRHTAEIRLDHGRGNLQLGIANQDKLEVDLVADKTQASGSKTLALAEGLTL